MTSVRAEMRLKSSHHTGFIVAEIFDFPAYQRGDRTVVRLADGESGLSDGRSGSAGFRSVGRDRVVNRLSRQAGEQLGQLDVALGGPVGHQFGKGVTSGRGWVLSASGVLVVSVLAGGWASGLGGAVAFAVAPLLSWLVGWGAQRRLVRRFGGLTGDLLGALIEVTQLVFVVVLGVIA